MNNKNYRLIDVVMLIVIILLLLFGLTRPVESQDDDWPLMEFVCQDVDGDVYQYLGPENGDVEIILYSPNPSQTPDTVISNPQTGGQYTGPTGLAGDVIIAMHLQQRVYSEEKPCDEDNQTTAEAEAEWQLLMQALHHVKTVFRDCHSQLICGERHE